MFEIQNHWCKPRWMRWFHPISVNRDNAKHPVEVLRNDSSGIIGPHVPSTEWTRCPPTVFDAESVKDRMSPLSTRPCGGGQPPSNAWKPAQSNKTPPCPHFDRRYEHRHDLGGTLFLGKPEIPDLTSQVNPDPHVSTGVSETNTSPTLIREFGSNRLNLHQILQRNDHG